MEAIKKLKHLRKVCKVGDVISPVDEQWDVENDFVRYVRACW